MHRYSIYLAVALLAFGIGAFAVMNFYWKVAEETLSSEPREMQEQKSSQNIPQDDIPTDEQFEKWKMDSLKPILEKWLKNQKIDEYYDLERNDGWALSGEYSARTKLIDVNSDGEYELALQTGCATVGNCEFYVFKKTKESHEIILIADMVQRFKLKKYKSNGYFDLETTSHGNVNAGGVAIYTFDGKEYKINKCFSYEYEITKMKNDQYITKNNPTLTPASCEN